jgi:hypothetical protein
VIDSVFVVLAGFGFGLLSAQWSVFLWPRCLLARLRSPAHKQNNKNERLHSEIFAFGIAVFLLHSTTDYRYFVISHFQI